MAQDCDGTTKCPGNPDGQSQTAATFDAKFLDAAVVPYVVMYVSGVSAPCACEAPNTHARFLGRSDYCQQPAELVQLRGLRPQAPVACDRDLRKLHVCCRTS